MTGEELWGGASGLLRCEYWYVHHHGAYPGHHHPHKGSHKPRPGARGKHHRKHTEKHVKHRFHHEHFRGRRSRTGATAISRSIHDLSVGGDQPQFYNLHLAELHHPPYYRHLHEPRHTNTGLLGFGPINHTT